MKPMAMFRSLAFVLWIVALASPAGRAEATEPVPAHPVTTAVQLPPVADESLAAPLVFQGDTIITFHAIVAGVAPQRRVENTLDRLEGLSRGRLRDPVRTEALGAYGAVLVGDVQAFIVSPGDGDGTTEQEVPRVADAAAKRLARALDDRAQSLAPRQRLRSALNALLATLGLVAGFFVLSWARRLGVKWFSSRSESGKTWLKLRFGDIDFLSRFRGVITGIATLFARAGGLVLITLWVVFVLNLFPETERWGAVAHASLLQVLQAAQRGLLRAIPGLLGVTLVVIGARFATGIASEIFHGLERGTIRIPGMHPETMGATRRLVNAAIWLFAIVVAYPLVPGSDSAAFKGMSVFVGLLVTLGSSGVVGHMMSGLVLIYSRAMQRGDIVRVGEIEGVVAEVGALSIKITNIKKEEFTIPHAVIVGTTVKNYSRVERETGVSLSTSVTIGYDAPWRVVHEMLLGAAERTAGIRKQPAPMVLQSSLSDFYVEYQLVTRVESDANRLVVLNQLHQNIQDAFNERGVQIMSPHYESQPGQPVTVPKSKWNKTPVEPTSES